MGSDRLLNDEPFTVIITITRKKHILCPGGADIPPI